MTREELARITGYLGGYTSSAWTIESQIEYRTAPSTGTYTTDATTGGTSGTTTIDFPTVTAPSPMPNTWFDTATGDVWDAPPTPTPKPKRRKKAIHTPIKISPRNPGMRRILLED